MLHLLAHYRKAETMVPFAEAHNIKIQVIKGYAKTLQRLKGLQYSYDFPLKA